MRKNRAFLRALLQAANNIRDNTISLRSLLLAKSKKNFTALHFSAAHDCPECMRLILDAARYIDDHHETQCKLTLAKNDFGYTALDIAYEQKNEASLDLLIAKYNKLGISAKLHPEVQSYDWSTHDTEIIEQYAKTIDEDSLLYLQQNYEHYIQNALEFAGKSCGSTSQDYGYTPLHESCSSTDQARINLIFTIADKHDSLHDLLLAQNCYGNTALHLGCYKKNAELVSMILNRAAQNNLLPDLLVIENECGENALHASCHSNDFECIQLLIKKARCLNDKYETLHRLISARNNDGYTPLGIALINNNSRIINLLCDAHELVRIYHP